MTTTPDFTPHGVVARGDLITSEEHGDAFEVMAVELGGYRRLVSGWYWADDANVGDLTSAARIAVAAAAGDPLLAIVRDAFERNLWAGALVASCTGSRMTATIDHVSWFPNGVSVYVVTPDGESFAFDPDGDPFGWRVETDKGVPIMMP